MTHVHIIAGEQSGDALGARLMIALRQTRPEVVFSGIGGPLMEAQGLRSLFPMRELAVMGLLEVLPRVFRLRRLLQDAVADVLARRPDVLVTIDSPGFTIRMLKLLKNSGLKRVHYVAPQVWAWREHRVRAYPGLWDRLLCLLPFEPAFFAGHGVPAVFVGHPVLESGADTGDAARFRACHGIAPEAKIVILMPGSRRSEVGKLLPVFGETLARLAAQFPELVPVVPVASVVADSVIAATSAWPVRPIVVTELHEKHDAFAAADVALTKSGTSTLELALAGVPMAVTYRVNPLTAAIVRRLIKVKYVAIVNLLAGQKIVPELLQADSNPARLAGEVARLLDDPVAAAAQRMAFRDIAAMLTPEVGLPSEAAALEVLDVMQGGADRMGVTVTPTRSW